MSTDVINWGLNGDLNDMVLEGRALEKWPWQDEQSEDVFRHWARSEEQAAESLLDLVISYEQFQRTLTAASLQDVSDCVEQYREAGGRHYDLTPIMTACLSATEAGTWNERDDDLIKSAGGLQEYINASWNPTYARFCKRVEDYRRRWTGRGQEFILSGEPSLLDRYPDSDVDDAADTSAVLVGSDGHPLDGDFEWTSDPSGLVYVFDRRDSSTTLATLRHRSISMASSGTIRVRKGVPEDPLVDAALKDGGEGDRDRALPATPQDRALPPLPLLTGGDGKPLQGDFRWSSDDSGEMYIYHPRDPQTTLARTFDGTVTGRHSGTIEISNGVVRDLRLDDSGVLGPGLADYDATDASRRSVDVFRAMVAPGASEADRSVAFMDSGEHTLLGHVCAEFGAVNRAAAEGWCQGSVRFVRHRTSPNEFVIQVTQGQMKGRHLEGWLKLCAMSEDNYPYRDRGRLRFS